MDDEKSLISLCQKISERTGMIIRDTSSNTYRILVDPNINNQFKKGIFYWACLNASNFIVELQLYSTKEGAHLVPFRDAFNEFNNVCLNNCIIDKKPKGLASRWVIKIPVNTGVDNIVNTSSQFIKLLNPKVSEVLSKIEIKVNKKISRRIKQEGSGNTSFKMKKIRTYTPIKTADAIIPELNPEIFSIIDDIKI